MSFFGKHSYLFRSLISLLSFVFLLFPCSSYEVVDQTLYEFEGIELVFGYQSGKYEILGFNIFGLLMFIFLLVSIIAPLFYDRKPKLEIIIETFSLLMAVILYFLLPITTNHLTKNIEDIFKVNAVIYIGAGLLTISLLLSAFELYRLLKESKKNGTIN